MSRLSANADRAAVDRVRGFKRGLLKPTYRLQAESDQGPWVTVADAPGLKDLAFARAELPPAVRAKSRVVRVLPGAPAKDDETGMVVRILEVTVPVSGVPW